ncbi:MAG: ferritin family protein [Planctomycetota bacterium]
MAQLITFSELINAAIAAEDAAQRVYLAFKAKFLNRMDVAEFWQAMADDESDHAQILASIHGRVPIEDLTMLVGVEMAEKAYELQGLNVQELIDSVSNLNDAYEIAYALESSEVNTVFNFLAIQFLSTDESYVIVSSTIDRHLLRLAEFTRTFGDAEHCRQVLASV